MCGTGTIPYSACITLQTFPHLVIINVAIVEAFIRFKVKAAEKIVLPARD